MKGELKGKGFKNQREEVTRQTDLVAPCSLSCRVPKDPSPTANPSNKTLMESFEISTTKPHPKKKPSFIVDFSSNDTKPESRMKDKKR